MGLLRKIRDFASELASSLGFSTLSLHKIKDFACELSSLLGFIIGVSAKSEILLPPRKLGGLH